MVGHRDGELEAGVGCRGAVDKSGMTLAQVSILCLAPVPRKKGDPSGSLGQGGGWGCGAKDFSHGWGGGRCRRLGGGHHHAGVLLHVSPNVWSIWRYKS